MKQVIKLTESNLRHIIYKSVLSVLRESTDTLDSATEKDEAKYEQILQDEFMKAQKDIQNSRATFHNGIRDSLLSKGYIVQYFGDNWIRFYGPSRLFGFYAHGFDAGYRGTWKLTDKIKISFSNYTWQERYQYPDYYHTKDYKEIKISNFSEFYQTVSKQIGEPLILKPFKASYEKIDIFKKFKVIEGGNTNKVLAEFDNFEYAKKEAYKIANEECKRGKQRNDTTSRYYHYSPIDVTKNFTNYAVAYEFYDYSEHAYYIAVVAE